MDSKIPQDRQILTTAPGKGVRDWPHSRSSTVYPDLQAHQCASLNLRRAVYLRTSVHVYIDGSVASVDVIHLDKMPWPRLYACHPAAYRPQLT
jgi:hypothetical protein